MEQAFAPAAEASMKVTTSWLRDCSHLLHLFREEAPLPYALCMFAYVDDDRTPAAMIEFFFYDEASERDPASIHDVALALGRLVPLDEVIHVRDARVRPPWRTSALLPRLSVHTNTLGRSLGARYMTAASGGSTSGFLQPWRDEARRLGMFRCGGEERAWYLAPMRPLPQPATPSVSSLSRDCP